jgi:hypothetical protein
MGYVEAVIPKPIDHPDAVRDPAPLSGDLISPVEAGQLIVRERTETTRM